MAKPKTKTATTIIPFTGNKHGLPRAVKQERDDQEDAKKREQSFQEFQREMFGSASIPQDGLPPLDWLKEQYKTKSAAIRYLINQGHAVKVIAKHLDVRYQHARNVATSTLKRGPNEDWRPKKPVPQNIPQHTADEPEDEGEPEAHEAVTKQEVPEVEINDERDKT